MLFHHPALRGLAVSVLAALTVTLAVRGQELRESDAQTLSQEAYEALKRGNAALAVREYRQLLEAHPEMMAARANLAAALVSLGRFDDAIAEYQKALKEEPGNPALLFNVALTYFGRATTRKRLSSLPRSTIASRPTFALLQCWPIASCTCARRTRPSCYSSRWRK